MSSPRVSRRLQALGKASWCSTCQVWTFYGGSGVEQGHSSQFGRISKLVFVTVKVGLLERHPFSISLRRAICFSISTLANRDMTKSLCLFRLVHSNKMSNRASTSMQMNIHVLAFALSHSYISCHAFVFSSGKVQLRS